MAKAPEKVKAPNGPDKITDDLLRPLCGVSPLYIGIVLVLGAIIAAAAGALGYQIYKGFGVVGVRRPVFWGFYITNFVFWLGLSMAGTLISAMLRLCNATWRRPITRCAELVTVLALAIGGTFPVIHLGRPWLAFWLFPYPSERLLWPNVRSPLLWDFFAINTYLVASLVFLVLPMVPDFALIRDRSTGLRQRIYGTLAIGWRGTPRQWSRLEGAMHIMSIVIIPVAVFIHSIVAWDFAMAPVPMWHSTIFAPYFVLGAIFSGIGLLILVMAALRKFMNLEDYLLPLHFENLGKLLLVMSLLWFYFNFAEALTAWYGNETSEIAVLWSKMEGPFAPLFWTMVVFNFVIPVPILAIKKLRTITGTCIASATVIVGMWLERFLIVVPSLSRKNLPYSWVATPYSPTWVEITITTATFAGLILLYMLLSKFIPIISIWELKWTPRTEEEESTPLVPQVGEAD
jgi:Ni/Fe-hydrogenase subunit HybB-like protein